LSTATAALSEEDPVFVGLTTEICAQAWDLIEPSIAHGASTGLLNGPVGSLLVLNPLDNSELFIAHPGGMIHEETLRNARGKAAVALRTGADTSRLRDHSPHLYAPGDISYPGGIVREGLVVAYSGVQGEYDEMIAEWFVSAVRAICRVQFAGPDGGDSQPTPYLGREG
jgi:hypothetical protein